MSKLGRRVIACVIISGAALATTASNAKDLNFPGYQGPPPLIFPFVTLEGGFAGSNASFENVAPPFDVNGTTGVLGVNGGFLINMPGSPISIGPRVGVLFGLGSNSITAPPASPGFTYEVKHPWTTFYEAEAMADFATRFRPLFNGIPSGVRIFVSAGAATTNTKVTGTAAGFSVTSENSVTGITGSIGLGVPLSNSTLLTGQVRVVDIPRDTYLIPGPVDISGTQVIGTIGLTYQFNAPLPPMPNMR